MKFLRKFLPHESHFKNSQKFLWIRKWLYSHPQLWHFNRQSVARGFGVGIFAAVIPLPVQMLLAMVLAVLVRGNIPVAVLATWLTNPFTAIPVLYLIYKAGGFVLGESHHAGYINHNLINTMHDFSEFDFNWINFKVFLLSLGKNFFIGLPIVALGLGILGYFLIYISWYVYIFVKIRLRRLRRKKY